nr:hypothetical protein [uncultured bacterium]
MPASLSETITLVVEQMFVGPLWPASILVCLLAGYTLMAMFGLIDFGMDAPEIDLDPGLDIDPAIEIDVPDVAAPDAGGVPADWDFWQGIGGASVRWTNFGRIPIIIWGATFAFSYWIVSYLLWHGFDADRYSPTLIPSLLLSLRNVVIATAMTKGLTEPLLGYFIAGPSYDEANLIGATCEVSTTEATPDFGQAKFRTNAAPLLLNIRTDGPHVAKGTEVKIIGFDRSKRIYTVTQLTLETQS